MFSLLLEKEYKLLFIIVIMFFCCGCVFSCKNNRTGSKVGVCEELVKFAKRINDNAPLKWTNGYTVISATYKDDLFTYRFIVNDSLDLYSKIANHIPEFKENLIVGIQVSSGEERDRYIDFAEYGITIRSEFECKVSKDTCSFTVSPEEIS